MVNGVRVELTDEEAIVIQSEWDKNKLKQANFERDFGYITKREKEYPPLGDQLDVIISYIRAQANATGDMLKLLDTIAVIKTKYPKP